MRSEAFLGFCAAKIPEELRYQVQFSVIYSSMIFVKFLMRGWGLDIIMLQRIM